jgi:hypothetical protein
VNTLQALLIFAFVVLYALFLYWWGGTTRPLSAQESAEGIRQLRAVASGPDSLTHLDEVQQLLAQDDGREFVMFNAVRYRSKARYPQPQQQEWGDDPRLADKRYGKAIIGPLIKRACLPLFIARKTGQFVNVAQAPDWHYVALVRYRSKRDFLRFALEIESKSISVHKWAAIEQTHIFPVQPLISLFFVRLFVGAFWALTGWALAGSFA